MGAISDLKLTASGKVREVYDLGQELLLVASDRISTFDAVHPNPIPDKGAVLTAISTFWFEQTASVVPNHFVSVTDGVPAGVRGRAMVVKRLQMLPVEAIVRGYLAGSGWRDYQRSGSISGVALPPGLCESSALPEPIFTPTTKANFGHDEAISFAELAELLGDRELAERLRAGAIALYRHAAAHARARGILVADTKFEFGLDAGGVLTLGDEALTPDSSRFWPADGYEPGHGQPSFDKQIARDWAASTGWDKLPPAPEIPPQIAARTRARYIEAYERLTGAAFSDWLTRTGAAPTDTGAGIARTGAAER